VFSLRANDCSDSLRTGVRIGCEYTTTNGRAVIALADVGGDGTLATADTVTLIGTIAMSAADYATFNGNNIAFVDF
jgi:hypothetical protein